jgi:hypothetical protein
MILRKMITAVAIAMILAGSMLNVRAEEGEAPTASADLRAIIESCV